MLNKKRYRNNSFLSKLYDIINDEKNKKSIHWNEDGTCIIISNVTKFSNEVLPKYYKHNNYSSFIRQLNMYGFQKCQGVLKDGERFEHEKFKKNFSKEQINNLITRHDKTLKTFSKYIKDKNKNFEDEELSIRNQNDIIKFLLEKNEENINNIIELRKEVEILKNENKNLNKQIQMNKNGNYIIFEKFIKKKGKTENKKRNKIKNLKELFTKYLYFLKIYSPYLMVTNDINYISEKVESFKIDNTNNKKIILIKNFNNYNTNNTNNNSNGGNQDSFFNGISFLSYKQYNQSFDLNMPNFNSSFSLMKQIM